LLLSQQPDKTHGIYHVAPREGVQSLAQRYAEGRKGMGLKIVGYAADSILQVFFAEFNQERCIEAKSKIIFDKEFRCLFT
jgi:hypothetical protein